MKPRLLHRSEPAQVIVLFALGLIGFLAVIGVIVDGGTLYLQRRTAQNAADAAALAGARALQHATQSTTGTIGDAICTYMLLNAFGVPPVAAPQPYFVDSAGTTNLGTITLASGCAASPASLIPSGASGVHVDVNIGPYSTYLVGIVGLRQLQAHASATAQVGLLGIPRPDLIPLAGCGPDMLIDGTSPTPFANILNSDGSVDASQFSPPRSTPLDVVLQGSQMTQNEIAPQGANCPSWNGSSAWKGKVDISGVTGAVTPPFTLPVATGNGSIDTQVGNACMLLYSPMYGASANPVNESASASVCYLLIPIAAPPDPTNQANIVTLACFKIYDGGNGRQKWRGILVAITTNTCAYGVFTPGSVTPGDSYSETQVSLT